MGQQRRGRKGSAAVKEFKKSARMKLAALALRVAWWLARPSIAGVPVCKHYDIVVEIKGTAICGGHALRVDGGTVMLDNFECIEVVEHDDLQKQINKLIEGNES